MPLKVRSKRPAISGDLGGRIRDSAGFSMVELMVVVAIIGIIMALAIPSFQGAKNTGADASVQQMLDRVLQAAEESYLSYGNFCGAVGLNNSNCSGTQNVTNPTGSNYTKLPNFNNTVQYVSQFTDVAPLTTSNQISINTPLEVSVGPANWSWGGSSPQFQMISLVAYSKNTNTCWYVYHIQGSTQAGAGNIGKTQSGTWYAKNTGTGSCDADNTYYFSSWGSTWNSAPYS